MSDGEHWLVKGLGGVNIITLIVILLAGAKLYFELDKDMAIVKLKMDRMEQTLSSIQDHLRRSDTPLYSLPPPVRSGEKL